MGVCGSAYVQPDDGGERARWAPGNITASTVTSAFPDFAEDALLRLDRQKMSITFSMTSGQGQGVKMMDKLNNGGSETGAELRQVYFVWDPKKVKAVPGKPKSAVLKVTDVCDMPQMKLLTEKMWLKRQIMLYVMGMYVGKTILICGVSA